MGCTHTVDEITDSVFSTDSWKPGGSFVNKFTQLQQYNNKLARNS